MTRPAHRRRPAPAQARRSDGCAITCSDGQRSQYNVETAAQRDGICIRTLRRAKFDLGVVSTKESISGCWNWALPENEELANAPSAP